MTIDKADLAPGDHVYSVLEVTGPVEWNSGSYVPTVDAAAGTRDRWTTTGVFTIKGATTTVDPIGTVTAGNEYAVLEAQMGKFAQTAGNNNVLPTLPGTWLWKPGTAFGDGAWTIKRAP